MNQRLITLAAVSFLPVFARADLLHLQDGRVLEGTIKREATGWVVTDANGKMHAVPDSAVKSIQKSSNIPPEVMAEAKIASLRRVVDSLSDPKQAVERYEKFIEQNKGTPVAAVAEKELAVWKDRAEKNLKKVGAAWVTPEQQAEMLGKSIEQAESARGLIKQGRLKEADAALNQLLAIDKTNVSGLYLKGVIGTKQEQLGIAKKNFEMVREAMPDHGPTLNNLGAILWMQKQAGPAIGMYEQAMAALPRNRTILDNVAEVLNALTENQKENGAGQRLAKRFAEQDAELATQLEKEGLYRWGATYVDKAKKAELDAAQQKVKERLDLLSRDYDRLNERLRQVDATIDANERTMRQMLRDRGFVDPYGNTVVSPTLPSAYYTLKRDNDRLKIERAGLVPELDAFREKAHRARQDLPVPLYTGKQQFFDVEGTPLAVAKKD